MSWPLSDAGLGAQGGSVAASSLLTTLTAGAANVMGSWTQLLAASEFDADTLVVQCGVSSANAGTLLDIGIGAAASERVLVQFLPIGFMLTFNPTFVLPMRVPAGSRVSARIQSGTASKTHTAQVRLVGGGLNAAPGFGVATTMGADDTISSGTALTMAGAINTKTAWTQVVASTANPIRSLLVAVSGYAADAQLAAGGSLVDIGVGGAGSEQVIVADVAYTSSSVTDQLTGPPVTVPCSLPAGVRLSARYQTSSISVAVPPRVTLVGFH